MKRIIGVSGCTVSNVVNSTLSTELEVNYSKYTETDVTSTIRTDPDVTPTITTGPDVNPTYTHTLPTELEVNPVVPTEPEVSARHPTDIEANPLVPSDTQNQMLRISRDSYINTPEIINPYAFPCGIETRLNLPFSMIEIQNTCPNFRSGELYRNYLISTVINCPNPLREEFTWNGSKNFAGGIVRKEQLYKEEYHFYKIHPTQWKYLDLHLKMVYIIWLRGLITPNRSRFTWIQIEAQCGESQKTLLRLLKEARKLFPEWYEINIPPPRRSKSSLQREEIRKSLNLPNRSTEWKNRGRLERQYLIQLEKDKGYKKKKILCAIFDIGASAFDESCFKSFKEYIDSTLNKKYGVKDNDLRRWMIQQIPDDYSCFFLY